MMIRNMHHAAMPAMIVAAEEIIAGRAGKVGGGVPGVFVHGNIPGLGHINAVEHVVAGDGVGDAGIQIVEVDIGHVVRKEDLVLLVHRHGGVFPPEEGVLLRGAVGQLDPGFQVGAVRAQHNAHHVLHAVHRLMLAQPADYAAVRAFLGGEVTGHKAGSPVMVGPVKLHPAGNPGPQRADQGGLDYMLAVEKVIPGGFVLGGKDTAADIRQDDVVQIVVFQMNGGILPVQPLVPLNPDGNLAGIYAARGPLMHAVFHKHGHIFQNAFRISGNGNRLNGDFCTAHRGKTS